MSSDSPSRLSTSATSDLFAVAGNGRPKSRCFDAAARPSKKAGAKALEKYFDFAKLLSSCSFVGGELRLFSGISLGLPGLSPNGSSAAVGPERDLHGRNPFQARLMDDVRFMMQRFPRFWLRIWKTKKQKNNGCRGRYK